MPPDHQLLTTLVLQLEDQVASIEAMGAHASARRIYRVFLAQGSTLVGIVNDDVAENQAFVHFSEVFKTRGLAVPSILAWNGSNAYLLTDLGDQTLMHIIKDSNTTKARLTSLYRQAIDHLLEFQTKGLAAIDPGFCFEGKRFDSNAIAYDVNSFCQEFLTRVGHWTQKDDLSSDIAELQALCNEFEPGYFMFRDFQSRNILVNEDLTFIDYQSGREGPLQYDLASLLFQSQANLSHQQREELLNYYVAQSKRYFTIDETRFKQRYLVFVLVRALQNLGAYGKLGLGQGKTYFKDSIPFALKNVRYILDYWPKELHCPNLQLKLQRITDNVNNAV